MREQFLAVCKEHLAIYLTDKASGVDKLSPRILAELKNEICRPVTEITKSSFDTGQTSNQSLKREPGTKLRTFVQ